MKINITLSTESIENAVSMLRDIHDNLDTDVDHLVAVLTNEGAMIAQSAYGGMASAKGEANGKTGVIKADGDAVLIAEFGAGQATMPVLFENSPATPVYEGSYSELVGSKEYAKYGSWHFGGKYYTEVPARHGLLDAKQYVIDHSTDIAMEVIQL